MTVKDIYEGQQNGIEYVLRTARAIKCGPVTRANDEYWLQLIGQYGVCADVAGNESTELDAVPVSTPRKFNVLISAPSGEPIMSGLFDPETEELWIAVHPTKDHRRKQVESACRFLAVERSAISARLICGWDVSLTERS